MIDLSKFDNLSELQEIEKNMQELSANEPKEVPDGSYRVVIDRDNNKLSTKEGLTVTETKKGEPMLQCRFKIVNDCDFKGQYLWKNIVLHGTKNDAWMLKQAVDFLDAVEPFTPKEPIEFKNYVQFGKLIESVYGDTKDQVYGISVKTNGDFKNVNVLSRV